MVEGLNSDICAQCGHPGNGHFHSCLAEAISDVPKGQWLPIADAPKDNTKFIAGGWCGERFYGDERNEYEQVAWYGEPQWVWRVTHDENASDHYGTRGWNHRNNPFPEGTVVSHFLLLGIPEAPPHGFAIVPLRNQVEKGES